jgi:histidine ammonia-lyase
LARSGCCVSTVSTTLLAGVVGDTLVLAAVLPRGDEDRDLRGDIALAESVLDEIGLLVAGESGP